MKVVLIYNAESGGKYDVRTLKRLCKKYDVTVTYSFSIKQLSSQKLRSLLLRGVTVAAVGGDGTQNAVARLIVGTKSKLLPLPGGSFNHFVRDLGMPLTVEDALKQIGTAKERTIDVAYVNDELFLNNSSLGLYPFSLVSQRRTRKFLGKYPSAVLSMTMELIRFRRLQLVIDGQKVRSPFVFVGNNIFDIKRTIIPSRTSFAKAVLTVMVATSHSRASMIRSAFGVLRGDIVNADEFVLSHRKQLSIYSNRTNIAVSFDGEVKRVTTPLQYRVAPKALRVITLRSS